LILTVIFFLSIFLGDVDNFYEDILFIFFILFVEELEESILYFSRNELILLFIYVGDVVVYNFVFLYFVINISFFVRFSGKRLDYL